MLAESSLKYWIARITSSILTIFHRYLYSRPIITSVVLTPLVGLFAIYSFGVLNYDGILAMYANRSNLQLAPITVSPALTAIMPQSIAMAHVLMLCLHTSCVVVLLLIAKQLGYSARMQWSLIFLLTFHLLLNDYRQYVFIAPLYWLLCLLSVWILVSPNLRSTLKLCLIFPILYLASGIDIIAWAWLLLLPMLNFYSENAHFLHQKPKLKLIFLNMLVYYLVIGMLFFIPHILGGVSGMTMLKSLMSYRQDNINAVGEVLASVWLRDENSVMSHLFLAAGSFSVVLLRTVFALGFASAFLLYYAVKKKQHMFIDKTQLHLLLSLITIDIALATLHVFLRPAYALSSYFIQVFLLLLLASPGLAYVFKKLQQGRFDLHWQLMIGWVLAGFIISGIVPFGPSNLYLRHAGEAYSEYRFVSNDAKVLFYGNKCPLKSCSSFVKDLDITSQEWLLFRLGRNDILPTSLKNRKIVNKFENRHNDSVLVFSPVASNVKAERE